MRSVKILGTTVALLTALLVLGPAMTLAEAGQDRYRSHRYENPDYPRGSYGWRGMRLFGFGYGKRCDELLRKAILPIPGIGTPTTRASASEPDTAASLRKVDAVIAAV
jgi:hypothetical protein